MVPIEIQAGVAVVQLAAQLRNTNNVYNLEVSLHISCILDCDLGYHDLRFVQPAMPASPIASNYPLNEQWAPLAVYGKRAPLQRKLWGQHKLTLKAPKTL